MESKSIYLDYNATTPVDPRVLTAMLPYFQNHFGNAASTSHCFGWEADLAVQKARKQVANLIGAFSKDIYFTSGATESNNLIMQGVFLPFIHEGKKSHLITSSIEHKCVLDTAKALEKWGVQVTYLNPNKYGQIEPDQVFKALKAETKLVSLIYGNNEIGSLNPIFEIGKALREHTTLFHTDAAQALGKIPISVTDLNIDFMAGSAQKMYGPKGVGFFYRNRENPHTKLEPIIFGGQQEDGFRPGTLNVPGIVGLGEACRIFSEELPTESAHIKGLQETLCKEVLNLDKSICLNGHPTERLSTNLSFTFKNIPSDILTMGLGGLALSSGSACSMGQPSHVLQALGLSPDEARKTVRIGIGRFTTEAHIQTCIQTFAKVIKKGQELSIT